MVKRRHIALSADMCTNRSGEWKNGCGHFLCKAKELFTLEDLVAW